MDRIKILLVEDEATLAMILQDTLQGEGFDVTVANDGVEGLRMMAEIHPDIVVADIMMPVMDGFDMVRRIRQSDPETPVLFLTARSSVDDVVEGFNIGANDYLRKPFSMRELIARVQALLRRANPKMADAEADNKSSVIFIGRYNLDTKTQLLTIGNEQELLSHRETEILRMLANHVNEVVSLEDILTGLWGDFTPYNAHSLQVFITKLRHKLAEDENIRIINVRGIGYKLIY